MCRKVLSTLLVLVFTADNRARAFAAWGAEKGENKRVGLEKHGFVAESEYDSMYARKRLWIATCVKPWPIVQ